MPELWNLIWGKPEIDPGALADAIDACVEHGDLDHRTRLLVRDATTALEHYWGPQRMRGWLDRSPVRSRIEVIRRQVHEAPGFPSLQERLMEPTRADTIRQYLRDLGTRIHHPARIAIGGAGALILHGCLSRATEDVDVVDEVPAEVRSLHSVLDDLQRLYGLHLAHFQSHFLPAGWERRLHPLGSFGRLEVALIDLYDLFLSKLFSARDKDLADLRQLWPAADRQALAERLQDGCTGLLAEPSLRRNAERNWYVLTGEALPIGL
jgi:uncharacterized nucleotidyltransferase DUF6036